MNILKPISSVILPNVAAHSITVKKNTFYYIPVAANRAVANGQSINTIQPGQILNTGDSTTLEIDFSTATAFRLTEVEIYDNIINQGR